MAHYSVQITQVDPKGKGKYKHSQERLKNTYEKGRRNQRDVCPIGCDGNSLATKYQ